MNTSRPRTRPRRAARTMLAGSASVPRRYAVHLAEWLPYDRMGSIGAALTIVGVLILIARFFAGVRTAVYAEDPK